MSIDDAIARLALTPRLLVALDFDGTLAPLADDPMSARMTDAAAEAVAALSAAPATTVAFVSGRTLRDLRIIAEHTDASPVRLAGSHGAEQWPPAEGGVQSDPAALALRDRLREQAEAIAAPRDGVWIEPKEFGFGVHTRLAGEDDAAAAGHAIDALMTELAPTWRRRSGHDIVEYAFRNEGKDTAVARLRETTGATAVLFAGDDVTDEDALAALGSNDVGVRVGAGDTAASVRMADIPEFAAFLSRLARERSERGGRPRGE